MAAACDDECVGVLLDDLEETHFLSVNMSAIGMAPYRRLVLLANRTRAVQVGAHADHMADVHQHAE